MFCSNLHGAGLCNQIYLKAFHRAKYTSPTSWHLWISELHFGALLQSFAASYPQDRLVHSSNLVTELSHQVWPASCSVLKRKTPTAWMLLAYAKNWLWKLLKSLSKRCDFTYINWQKNVADFKQTKRNAKHNLDTENTGARRWDGTIVTLRRPLVDRSHTHVTNSQPIPSLNWE